MVNRPLARPTTSMETQLSIKEVMDRLLNRMVMDSLVNDHMALNMALSMANNQEVITMETMVTT